MAHEMDPVLVAWEPKWTAPTVDVTCPSCGRRAERSASNWNDNIYTGLRMTLSCEPGFGQQHECWRVFDVTLPAGVAAAV